MSPKRQHGEINEIPRDVSTIEKLREMVNDRVTDIGNIIRGAVTSPLQALLDANRQRIIKLADPVDGEDAVNLRTLKRFGGTRVEEEQRNIGDGTPGPATLRTLVERYAQLTIKDLVVSNPRNVTQVDFTVPTIDETDVQLYAFGTIDATTDPVTFIADSYSQRSWQGTDFEVGDYVVWIDPTLFTEPLTQTQRFSYEIDRITGLNKTLRTFTLERHPASGLSWEAYYKSPMTAHTGKMFLRLIPRVFSEPIRWHAYGEPAANGLPRFQEFVWANTCAAAIAVKPRGAGGDGPVTITNLAPNFFTTPPYPGLRTMNGAAYEIPASGTISAGQRGDFAIDMEAWHSFRVIKAKFPDGQSPPVNLSVLVTYRQPDDGAEAVIEELRWGGGRHSWVNMGNRPYTRQAPYRNFFRVPELTVQGRGYPFTYASLLSDYLNGVDPPATVAVEPDGEFNLYVWDRTNVGLGTLSDLIVSVQT